MRAFAKDRSKRILVPMVAGWVLLAPPIIIAVVWGAARMSGGEIPPEVAEQQTGGFPLTHLWFLYYLSIFYVLAIAGRQAFVTWIDGGGRIRTAIDRIAHAVLPSFIAPWLLATPLVAVLYFDADWALWAGIPTPDVGLAPKLPAMTGFGTAFVAGWLLHRQTDVLQAWRSRWAVNLALAVILTIVCLNIVDPVPNLLVPEPASPAPLQRLIYAACYAAAIWYWSFGIIGAALRYFSEHNPARRYLADASYWLYLVHLPIVFFLQVAVADLPWHWTIKFPLILAITMALLLVSYHYLVRPTFIGEILNGRRYPRRPGGRGPDSPDPGTSGPDREQRRKDTASQVAVLEGVTRRFGQTVALDNVDLGVNRGELLAVLGPNGAGKTTAISLWLGMLEADEGTVRLMGRSPFDPESRLDVGMMLQDVTLSPELRTREHIALASSYYPRSMSVEQTMELTHTSMLADKRYGRLSSGQKRQVQFATAVCGRPRLLFLDEPTVGLDIGARETMWRTIRGLLVEGCSIVLTTHYLEEAEALADRVAVLAQGRLIAQGSVDEMRALVARKQIRCASSIDVSDVAAWPGVVDASRDNGSLQITATDAETVVRRLLATDGQLSNLEVRQASLAEAFTELTREAA